MNTLMSALQVHGHHPPSEASSVSQSHHRSYRLYLEFGCGSGLSSLLLLYHSNSAWTSQQNPLLRGLASQGQ